MSVWVGCGDECVVSVWGCVEVVSEWGEVNDVEDAVERGIGEGDRAGVRWGSGFGWDDFCWW